jgi:hypothetical protein
MSIVYLALCSFNSRLHPKMAKKKTRQQKILADSRHISYHLETSISARESYPSEKKIKVELPNMPRSTYTQTLNSYPHVFKDIKKTAFITGVILTVQIILFIVINSM